MYVNELLLITENCGGRCEHNFISTRDELRQKYMSREDVSTIRDFFACLAHSAGQNVWNTLYISNSKSLDVRHCIDRSDLKKFLAGEFNATTEMMATSFPGSAFNENWHWDNDVERFSPRAIDTINRECPEQLLSIGLKPHGGKAPLADIIKKASIISENASSRQEGLHRDPRTEIKEL